MPAEPSVPQQDDLHVLKAYRATFAASVCLAAIGAPLLMQGAVALVVAIFRRASDQGSLLQGLALFVLSAVPMTLAALAWRRTQAFQATLDREV